VQWGEPLALDWAWKEAAEGGRRQKGERGPAGVGL